MFRDESLPLTLTLADFRSDATFAAPSGMRLSEGGSLNARPADRFARGTQGMYSSLRRGWHVQVSRLAWPQTPEHLLNINKGNVSSLLLSAHALCVLLCCRRLGSALLPGAASTLLSPFLSSAAFRSCDHRAEDGRLGESRRGPGRLKAGSLSLL